MAEKLHYSNVNELNEIVTMRKKAIDNILKSGSGFSLMEIMVTLVVIAIVAALTAPAFLSMAPDMALKSAAQDLHSFMQRAKATAVKENRTVTVRFDTPGGGFYYIDENGDLAYTFGEPRVILDEDLNNNGVLDAGEDFDGNGKLDTNYGIKYGLGSVAADWTGTGCAPGVACDQSTDISFNSRGLATINPADSSVFLDYVGSDAVNSTKCYAVDARVAGGVSTQFYNGTNWK